MVHRTYQADCWYVDLLFIPESMTECSFCSAAEDNATEQGDIEAKFDVEKQK